MYARMFINTILVLFLSAVQLSFISALPAGLNNLNLILVVLIFILVLNGLKITLWWSVGTGVLLDIFSFSIFGFFLVSLILAMLAAYFLLNNFFTNRSLYSFMAITVLTSIFYKFIFMFLNYISGLISGNAVLFIAHISFWSALLYQVVLNLMAVAIIFFVINFISNRLKPVFLTRKSYVE